MTSLALRKAGWLFLGGLPLCYRHVPGLPPFLKALPLMAAGAAFGLAVLSERPAFPTGVRRAGLWAAFFMAWEALSGFWAAPAFCWTPVWPVLLQASAFGVVAGIASDPAREQGLKLALLGAAAALGVYGINLLTQGGVERWVGNPRLGLPIDHLPFGNRNLAALLISAFLPLAILRRAWLPAALLGALLWATNSLGAFLGLLGGGVLAWMPLRRSRIVLAGLASALLVLWLGHALSRRPAPAWRTNTSIGMRSLGWEEALKGWRERPWTGHAAGSFSVLEPAFRDPLYARQVHATPRMEHAYSLPLQAMFETGLPGLVLALGTLAAVFLSLRDPVASWTCGTVLVQALGGDALLDPIGLSAFAIAAGWGMGVAAPAAARRSPWIPAGAVAALILLGGQVSQALWFAEGRDLELGGDLGRAETAYAKASRAGVPSILSMEARFRRGQSLMSAGRFEEALEAYRDLMERAGPYGNAREMARRAEVLTKARAAEAGSPPSRNPSGSR